MNLNYLENDHDFKNYMASLSSFWRKKLIFYANLSIFRRNKSNFLPKKHEISPKFFLGCLNFA